MAAIDIEFRAQDRTGGVLDNLKSKLGGIFTVATGFLTAQVFSKIGSEIVNFSKDSIGAANDLNETINKTSEIFKDSSQAIMDWSKDSAIAVGLSQKAALDAASGFAIFGKGAGLAGDDLVKFSEDNLTLAADLASFFNTSVEDAAVAMQAAFRGETEPIRKYGILLDDASMRQKALELGIISTTKQALTPQQKVLAAQALIFAQTADAQGDFARTSGGLANQQRIFAAQVENAKAALGTAFLPVVTKVMTFLNTKGIPVLQQVIDWVSGLAWAFQETGDVFSSEFLESFSSFLPQDLQDKFFDIANSVRDFIGSITGAGEGESVGFFDKLKTVFQTLMPIVSGLGGVVMNTLWPALVQIAQAIAPLITEFLPQIVGLFSGLALEIVQRLLPPFMQLVGAVLPILVQLFSTVISAIMPLLDAILPPLTDLILMLIEAILPLIETLLPPLAELFATLISAIAPLLSAILPVLVELLGVIIELLAPLLELIAAGLVVAIEALAGAIEKYIIPAFEKFSEWIGNKVIPAIHGISDAIAPVIDWIGSLTEKLNNIKLPDWLTPGSPTPFEIGLRGIGSALQQVNSQVPGGISLAPAYSTVAGSAPGPTNSFSSSSQSSAGGITDEQINKLGRVVVSNMMKAMQSQ